MPLSATDQLLVERVRAGDADAWEELIARFEGRLLAFVESRTGNRAAAEDLVQEAFLGFLTSLPNYDSRRPLEGYLFSIAAHKLTDHLRREGRRPALPLAAGESEGSSFDPPGAGRHASSIVRSGERKRLEESALATALTELAAAWQRRGDWQKLACIEMLLVRGLANKDAAVRLNLSEQAVANYKFEFLAKLRTAIRRQDLPAEVFPEVQEER